MKFTIDALNHLLRQNSWAAEKLRAQQGKCIRIALPPFAQTLVIDGGGEFIAALPDATIDAEISLSPGAALRLLLQPQGAPQALLTGEMELASAVGRVLQGLEWDMEEDLSRVVGDIAAHQITQTGGRIRQELGRKLEAGSAMLAEYWLE